MVSTRCAGSVAPVSEFSRCPPALPVYSNLVRGPAGSPAGLDDSCQGQRSRGFDQLSRATRARVRMPRGSIAAWATRARVRARAGSTSCTGQLGPVSDVPWCRPAVPDDSHPCPSSRGFHQLSQTTHDPVRWPAVSTSCPGRFRPGSDFPRCRPAVPDDSRPCLRACGFDTLFR